MHGLLMCLALMDVGMCVIQGCDADILQLDVLDLVYTGTEGDAADVESDGEDC